MVINPDTAEMYSLTGIVKNVIPLPSQEIITPSFWFILHQRINFNIIYKKKGLPNGSPLQPKQNSTKNYASTGLDVNSPVSRFKLPAPNSSSRVFISD